MPDINAITYGIYVISKQDMIKYRNVVTESPTFKVLDEIESTDIDTEYDFMVEMIYKKLRVYNEAQPYEVTHKFEETVGEYCGAPYGVAVDNATNVFVFEIFAS